MSDHERGHRPATLWIQATLRVHAQLWATLEIAISATLNHLVVGSSPTALTIKKMSGQMQE
jgi:hypothetical protein